MFSRVCEISNCEGMRFDASAVSLRFQFHWAFPVPLTHLLMEKSAPVVVHASGYDMLRMRLNPGFAIM